VARLNKGDAKKKKKRAREEGEQGGLRKGVPKDVNDDEECVRNSYYQPYLSSKPTPSDGEDKDAKARRVVRANNFTQQTNALDVDKHMCVNSTPDHTLTIVSPLRMAYIEENLKIRSRPREDADAAEKGPLDPQEALYQLADRWKVDKLKLTPEVDLGME